MIRRSDPFGGDRARLAFDLGKAWACANMFIAISGRSRSSQGCSIWATAASASSPVLKRQSGISSAVSYVRRPSKRSARSAISKPR